MPLDNDTPKIRNNPHPGNNDEVVIKAHEEAEKDMEQDEDMHLHPSPVDDLDEGEFAQLSDKQKNEIEQTNE